MRLTILHVIQAKVARRSLGEVRSVQLTAARVLPIRASHITALAGLPALHKDPFDRILIAQAKAEGLGLVTSDGLIGDYPVQTIW